MAIKKKKEEEEEEEEEEVSSFFEQDLPLLKEPLLLSEANMI